MGGLRNQILVLAAFAFMLYANTLGHEYTQDDAIVIYDNMYTTQGIKGIPGLLTKDTFFGFFKTEGKDKLVSGGRYRPLTPVMFAVEWQLFGHRPWIGHIINVLIYALTVIVIFLVLRLLLQRQFPDHYHVISFIAALIFAAHPIHTEVVANIKGRDEIMAMIFSLSALWGSIKYIDLKKNKYLLMSGVFLFLGLLSKENTITFLAIIPISLLYFRKIKLAYSIKATLPAIVSTILFLGIRTSILGMDMGGKPRELLNNPFLKIVGSNYVDFSFAEVFATITFTLGKYLQLLVWPHPLTHDYYPRYVGVMQIGDWTVILSLLTMGVLLWLIWYFRRKHLIISYGIVYYFITLSIVSNIVFPIGTNMSERFLFMPSLGFTIIVAYLFSKFSNKYGKRMIWITTCIYLTLLSFKTVTRNMVWQDNYTLFTTDVKTSLRSAKVLNAAGGSIIEKVGSDNESIARTTQLNTALTYLDSALKIHPNYKNAYLLRGNAHYHLKNYEEAITAFSNALRLDAGFSDARSNLGVTYRDAGRYYGEEKGELKKAIVFLQKAEEISPNDYEVLRLLGVANGIEGRHNEAIKYFERAKDRRPNDAGAFVNLGTAYMYYGDSIKGQKYLDQALQIDPNALKKKQ